MHTIIWSTAAYLVVIGILVTFHEFGHYWVARRLGVKVLRFSIGFGKPLWRRVSRSGVEFVIAAVPLGGYVKMLDEREGPVDAAERSLAFNRQPVWRRAAIAAAGPAFNFVLAIIVYWALWVHGIPDLKPVIAAPPPQSAAYTAGLKAGETVLQVNGKPIKTWSTLHTDLLADVLGGHTLNLKVREPDGGTRSVSVDLSKVRVDPRYLFSDIGLSPDQPRIPPVLQRVLPGEPAAQAGFKAGDRLLRYADTPIYSWQQWVRYLQGHPGGVVNVEIARDGHHLRRTLAIGRIQQDGKTIGHFGAAVEVPKGLWHDLETEQRYSVWSAVPAALHRTWLMSVLTLQLGYRVITGDISVSNIGGPIRTAEAAGYSAQLGLTAFLSFLAFVSVNLGIVNLLPVPVLDGGHLLYCAAEAVRGSPLPERIQSIGQQVGLTLLVLLIGIVFYNDISSLMS